MGKRKHGCPSRAVWKQQQKMPRARELGYCLSGCWIHESSIYHTRQKHHKLPHMTVHRRSPTAQRTNVPRGEPRKSNHSLGHISLETSRAEGWHHLILHYTPPGPLHRAECESVVPTSFVPWDITRKTLDEPIPTPLHTPVVWM